MEGEREGERKGEKRERRGRERGRNHQHMTAHGKSLLCLPGVAGSKGGREWMEMQVCVS